MIINHDRSGWFGASDVSKIVGNWKTKTWMDWWLVKIGVSKNDFESAAMNAGTNWEHRILESLNIPDMEYDRQIIIPELKLRVNLDGNTPSKIYECKTHSAEKRFKPPKSYFEQVWVQMYASGIKEAEIVSYGLTEADYDNYLADIDLGRRKETQIPYNEEWIESVFLPKLKILSECLEKGVIPEESL